MMTVEQFHLLMFHSMHIAIIFSAERSNLRYIRQPCFVLNKHLSSLRRISGRVFSKRNRCGVFSAKWSKVNFLITLSNTFNMAECFTGPAPPTIIF